MWSFAEPLLLLLLPAPLLAARLLPPARREGGALRVPDGVGALLSSGRRGGGLAGTAAARRLPAALIWLALVVALAGPQRLEPVAALPASGRDVMFALDLSGSMERQDFSLDGEKARRLDAVKRVGAAFMRRREGDRVGLVIFAEEAFVAAALTHDVEAAAQSVEAASIGIAGRATGIGKGLGLALRRLSRSEAPTRVVILLSDGIDTGASVAPRDAARLAARLGIAIHTIALGPRDKDDGGDLRTVVDAQTLRDVAAISGGTFRRVRDSADLEALGDALDALVAQGAAAGPPAQVRRDLWVWPASVAFALSLALCVGRRGRA